MTEGKSYFRIDDDVCIKNTELIDCYKGEIISVGYKQTTVITKEAFIECYNKWIKADNFGAEMGVDE